MIVAITGASGLVGQALTQALTARGDKVLRLVRRAPRDELEIEWDPATGRVEGDGLGAAKAIVHLAGENVGDGRWTDARKERILRSRVDGTRTIARWMAARPDGPRVLVSASAVGYYGDTGAQVVTESSPVGDDFLATVCAAWEAEAAAAADAGVRVAVARFGVVLAQEGGALERLLPLFRMGLGGRLGSGDQFMSWVTLRDVVAGLLLLLDSPDASGAWNLTAPEPVTNRAFTIALAGALGRPALLPVPGFAMKVVMGEMADTMLLSGTRAVPERLLDAGFTFMDPTIDAAFAQLLRR